MAVPTYKYSGVCYTATASQTTFALTTSGGKSIGYLKQEHIKVRTSADSGNTWTGLSINTDYVFADPATSIVLNTGATAGTLVDIHRETPMDDDYIDFQAGSLLTAAELNLFDTWQLYIDQELEDGKASIDGTVPGAAVKSVTGVEPILVDNSNPQTPVVDIDQTDSTGDSNALTSDTRVMSEKAIDEAFKQYIGTAPTTGEKIGQLRIDPSGAIPNTFYWSGTAWVQIQTKGDQGDVGPIGPAPGLQTPPASASTVPLQGDGTLGTATANVEQDPTTKDLKFLFGIPQGLTGPKGLDGKDGQDGADSTVPGPPPGLQSPPATATSVGNNPDGSTGTATANVTQNGDGDLQFSFGIPVGQRGPAGPQGDPGDGVNYKGAIDATTAAEPANPANGDFYVNTVDGTSSWTGLGTVTDGTRIIWNANTNQWDAYTPSYSTDLGYQQETSQGTITNTNGDDAVIPLADLTYAGLMAPGDKNKLNGVEWGADVTPDLSNYLEKGDNISELTNDANYLKSGDNVSELTNDAGYLTSSDLPASAVTSVNTKTGDVLLGLQDILDQQNTATTDLWIGENGEVVKLLKSGDIEVSQVVRCIKLETTEVLSTKYRIDQLTTLP